MFDRQPTNEQLIEVMQKYPTAIKKRKVIEKENENEYHAIRWGLGLVTAGKIIDLAKLAQADARTISKALNGGVCSGLCVKKNGGQWSRMKLFRRDDGEYFHSADAAAHSVEGAVTTLYTNMNEKRPYKGFFFEVVEVPGEYALKIINNGGRDPQEEKN
jgi:hypothetical protein